MHSAPLRLLFEAKPAWAHLVLCPAIDLWFNAMPPPINDMEIGIVRLRFANRARGIVVFERDRHRRYPGYCLERHIVDDGAFCLGYKIRTIANSQDAQALWSDLHHFLALQAIAEQTGVWPALHALSHGPEAAEREIEARAVAKAHGIADDYDQYLDGDVNWLGECMQGHPPPPGKQISRGALNRLVTAERARDYAQRTYATAAFQAGRRCCGSMKSCVLRDCAPEYEADRISLRHQLEVARDAA